MADQESLERQRLFATQLVPDVPQVTVSMTVENTYADGFEQTNYATDVVVEAPAETDFVENDAHDLTDWADEVLQPFTGTDTGRENVDAGYEILITASSDPRLVGKRFEWY